MRLKLLMLFLVACGLFLGPAMAGEVTNDFQLKEKKAKTEAGAQEKEEYVRMVKLELGRFNFVRDTDSWQVNGAWVMRAYVKNNVTEKLEEQWKCFVATVTVDGEHYQTILVVKASGIIVRKVDADFKLAHPPSSHPIWFSVVQEDIALFNEVFGKGKKINKKKFLRQWEKAVKKNFLIKF